MNTGVVLGCFNYPKLIELQINLIRFHNGPVPIFISDDCSSKSNNYKYYEDLMELATKYTDVTVWSNPQRLGHAGGDLVAFHLGIQWAYFRKLPYLIKLSQRMCVDIHDWITPCVAGLVKSGLKVSSASCVEGGTTFPIRTEFVLMDTKAWYHPNILNEFRMQSTQGHAAESIIWRVIDKYFEGKMAILPILKEDRLYPYPGIVWHCSHTLENYKALAERFSLTLDKGFAVTGWHLDPDYKT
jgi:hypothetical protein